MQGSHRSFKLPELLPHTIGDIRSHAIQAWPFECCGVIIDGHFHAKKNIHSEPTKGFRIAEEEWSDDIQAIIHSHPDVQDAVPSSADLMFAQSCNRPFGIIPTRLGWAGELRWVGDYTLETPLVGRQFIHGVYDCYSLARAYYWQTCGIYMRDYPRDPEWWLKQGPNLYVDNFQKEGFEVVFDELQEHDALLIKVVPGTKGPHHVAIITGNSLLLHHWGSQLSCHTPMSNWLRHTTHRVRHAKFRT